MAFSYSAVWDDTTRLLREHGRLLTAVAGVFLFLPALLIAHFLPPPEPVDPNRAMQAMVDYWRDGWHWLLLQMLVTMIGTAAMLRLVLARGTNVGGAIAFGLTLLPFYFLLTLLCVIIVTFGFLLLIVPGLYLIGRLAPATAAIVAENGRNPIAAVARAFEITRGRGWAVFGLVFIVGFVGAVAFRVAAMLLGLAFHVAAGDAAARLLTAVTSSALNAGFATVMLMLYAAIYRALAGAGSAAATFE